MGRERARSTARSELLMTQAEEYYDPPRMLQGPDGAEAMEPTIRLIVQDDGLGSRLNVQDFGAEEAGLRLPILLSC